MPRLLVGNKSDLADRRKVREEVALAFAKERGMLAYVETSAIETTNINEAFMELVKRSTAEGKRQD